MALRVLADLSSGRVVHHVDVEELLFRHSPGSADEEIRLEPGGFGSDRCPHVEVAFGLE